MASIFCLLRVIETFADTEREADELAFAKVIEFDELKLHCPISGDPHEVVWSEDSNGSSAGGHSR